MTRMSEEPRYTHVDQNRWADHPLEDEVYINCLRSDGYKLIDDKRYSGRVSTT